ncbi:MAG: hypothetical protein DMF86_13390 [Acidobacteria bacterium]|nr:MAG: hypothetical protein DMF86_13390 [Acidobacteriota bacterium]
MFIVVSAGTISRRLVAGGISQAAGRPQSPTVRSVRGVAVRPARRPRTEGGEALLRAEWFAIWTHSHCEQLVHDQLAGKGFEVFLPTIRVWSRRAGKRRLIPLPMFPGYLFAHCTMDKGDAGIGSRRSPTRKSRRCSGCSRSTRRFCPIRISTKDNACGSPMVRSRASKGSSSAADRTAASWSFRSSCFIRAWPWKWTARR